MRLVIGSVVLCIVAELIGVSAHEQPVRPAAPSLAHANARRGRPPPGGVGKSDEKSRGTASMASARTIQASCQAHDREKPHSISILIAVRQAAAGAFRIRNLRSAQSLCAAQSLCNSSCRRPGGAPTIARPGSQGIDISTSFRRRQTARNLLPCRGQRRLRLAALLQPLAAAFRKLNCFAALSVIVTRSPRLRFTRLPTSIALVRGRPARTAQDVQPRSRRRVRRSHLRSKRIH